MRGVKGSKTWDSELTDPSCCIEVSGEAGPHCHVKRKVKTKLQPDGSDKLRSVSVIIFLTLSPFLFYSIHVANTYASLLFLTCLVRHSIYAAPSFSLILVLDASFLLDTHFIIYAASSNIYINYTGSRVDFSSLFVLYLILRNILLSSLSLSTS